jgi:HlyD family secretion protein
MNREYERMKKYIVSGAIVILAGLAGYFLFFNGKSKQDAQPAGQVQRVVKVTRGDLNLNVSSDGVVQPINKVELRSKAGGKIVQLNFIEGQLVKQGDLLILVDQTITKNNLDQANADLETAQASLLQAQNTDNRTQELFSKGLVSQQEVDQSKTDLVRAQAQLVKAKAALSNAEDQMNDTRIGAPVSGIVLSKSVELGQLISSATSNVGGGTLLATVADMNDVYVYAKVDEVDIGKVKAGQKVSIIADAYQKIPLEEGLSVFHRKD